MRCVMCSKIYQSQRSGNKDISLQYDDAFSRQEYYYVLIFHDNIRHAYLFLCASTFDPGRRHLDFG